PRPPREPRPPRPASVREPDPPPPGGASSDGGGHGCEFPCPDPPRGVRQPRGPTPYDAAMPAEKVRLRIGNLAKAVLASGQAYQDAKDALNEFVSNAADEYAEAGRRGERITVVLRRKGRHPLLAVDDVGRGMSQERL